MVDGWRGRRAMRSVLLTYDSCPECNGTIAHFTGDGIRLGDKFCLCCGVRFGWDGKCVNQDSGHCYSTMQLCNVSFGRRDDKLIQSDLLLVGGEKEL